MDFSVRREGIHASESLELLLGSRSSHLLVRLLVILVQVLHRRWPWPAAQPQCFHGKFLVTWYLGFRIFTLFPARKSLLVARFRVLGPSNLPDLAFFSIQKLKVTCASNELSGTQVHDEGPYFLGDISIQTWVYIMQKVWDSFIDRRM